MNPERTSADQFPSLFMQVVPASVDGTVIVVTGVSAGSTEIVVQAGSEEFHVPVQVGG